MHIFLIIILSIWLLGKLGRWWLRRVVERRMQGGHPGRRQERRSRPEGQVSVERTIRMEKRVNSNVGDYVEFEEVEVNNETCSGE